MIISGFYFWPDSWFEGCSRVGGFETVDSELDEDPLDSLAILTFFFFYYLFVLSDDEPPALETLLTWESDTLNTDCADLWDDIALATPTPFFFISPIVSSIISIWFI